MNAPISKETASLISTFKEPLTHLLKGAKNEISFFFDDGVATYVDNLRNKISKTKTFLHRNEEIYFYDTYFPITLTRMNGKTKVETPSHEPNELFKFKNYIAIIGNAGSGKTMFMKHCFLTAIKTGTQIPILIELRTFNREPLSITEYIYKIILRNELSPSSRIVERILENGKFLFLFDGYDEIFSDKKNKIIDDLEEFVDTYNKNKFLITSRPGANAEALPRFNCFHVEPLNKEQIKRFVHLQLRDDDELEARVLNTINAPENIDYRSYLSSPLLLSMFLLTYNSYPELPKSKYKFYWNVFDTLCTKHDSYTKKGGFLHERKSGLQNEELENILRWLAYVSLFDGHYSFDESFLKDKLKLIRQKLNLKYDLDSVIYDLVVSISILILDGNEYKFPHKSLQEYFVAMLIKEQSNEAKDKIYSERFVTSKYRVTYKNFNLWSLCLEIDKYALYTKFFISKLNNFLQIKQANSDSLALSFYRQFSMGEGFTKKSRISFVSYTPPAGIIIDILEFFGLTPNTHDITLSHSVTRKTLITAAARKYGKADEFFQEHDGDYYWLSYSNIPDEELDKIIDGSRAAASIEKLFSAAETLCDRLIHEINTESTAKNDLLDL